jgi:hypothetical protein
VTDFRADSPVLARLYCPGCEPDADPFAEILDVHWCDAHVPSRDGSDDAAVAAAIVVSGSAEAGGDGNRRWCELFHREARRATPSSARRRRRQPRESAGVTPPEAGASSPGHGGWPHEPGPMSPEVVPVTGDASRSLSIEVAAP